MKRIVSNWKKGLLCTSVLAACSFASLSIFGSANTQAAPFKPCICPFVYAPVTCDGGVVYSNACFASCAEATGCVPGIIQ